MILKQTPEMLTSLIGTKKIDAAGGFDALCDQAYEIYDSFEPMKINAKEALPICITGGNNPKLTFTTGISSERMALDMSRYAFQQACGCWGIPSAYMEKLFTTPGLEELGEMNIREMTSHRFDSATNGNPFEGQMVLASDGVAEAVLSDKYCMDFPVFSILDTMKGCVDFDRYTPNQAYLSKSKFHIRFVDFDHPAEVGGEKISVGFTVDSSDIGKSSLKVRFFLYKFACQNGIVRIGQGGTLYRQRHLGNAFGEDDIDEFRHAFEKVAELRESGLELIREAQKKSLSLKEMDAILDTARKNNVSVTPAERTKIISLAQERYGLTRWGVINGITEVAQQHSLDERLAHETWAGVLLAA